MVTFNLQENGIYSTLLDNVFRVLIQDLYNNNIIKYNTCIGDTQILTKDEERFKILSYQISSPQYPDDQLTTLSNIINELIIVLKEEGNYTDNQMEMLKTVIYPLEVQGVDIISKPKDHIILYTDTESLEIHLNDHSITFIYHFTGQYD